jgi:hypothetical protein
MFPLMANSTLVRPVKESGVIRLYVSLPLKMIREELLQAATVAVMLGLSSSPVVFLGTVQVVMEVPNVSGNQYAVASVKHTLNRASGDQYSMSPFFLSWPQ